jgi:hypothetical protein
MEPHQRLAIEELKREGYAVIVWTPDELDGIDPYEMECHSIQKGWDFIDMNSDSNSA